jgi:hypothetical protein
MEDPGRWTLSTGGKPFLYIKPGCKKIKRELIVGVDHFDNLADVQTYARQHYGWQGNDTEGLSNAGKTSPNQKTQVMAVTPSPSNVKLICPICYKFITTYRKQSRDPLPLTTYGNSDWDGDWPRPSAQNMHVNMHVNISDSTSRKAFRCPGVSSSGTRSGVAQSFQMGSLTGASTEVASVARRKRQNMQCLEVTLY